MYKKNRNHQFSLADFNQPMGLKLNPENQWIRKAALIPWDEIEDKYAALFPSNTGTVAKPLRMALGSLMIQKEYGFSDRDLIDQIQMNPYYQFFIGLPGYQMTAPFSAPLLVEFRKRLSDEVINEINEMIIEHNKPEPPAGSSSGKNNEAAKAEETANNGTLIVDATCAPQNISFPQDINLLNEAREDLEEIIDDICYENNLCKPRMYRDNARRDYLSLARSKKRTVKKIRKAIKKQLQYICRDRGQVDWLEENGYPASEKQKERLKTIDQVYAQQKYMYEEDIHTVPNRIVSISQPFVRPIVRGKAAAPVEFGAKLDISVVNGLGRIEKISFESYNESEMLPDVVGRYRDREGHYPERVLADKIYRNRKNLQYCKEHGIRLSGPALGRPKKGMHPDRKLEYIDNADRVEVERAFSLSKRSFGLGLIRTKLEVTTRGAIALSILAMNLSKLAKAFLRQKLEWIFSRYRIKIREIISMDFENSFDKEAVIA